MSKLPSFPYNTIDYGKKDRDDINFLSDVSKNGKNKPWVENKKKSLLLSESYKRLGLKNKSFRVSECGTFLEFKKFVDGSLKLNGANFCKVRLCPMCSWRRSLKIFSQVSEIMNYFDSSSYSFLFLTLTCKNCSGAELKETISNLFKSFNLLSKNKKFKSAVKGYFRALEVSHNLNINSESYNTFHPHFHLILAVPKNYFVNPDFYISHSEWIELWKKCLKVNYSPIVDVRKFKTSNISKSVAEVAKYTVKSSDYLVFNDKNNIDEDLTDYSVLILDEALSRRRLISFGGCFKTAHKKLNLDDSIDGDLTDSDEIRDDLNYIIEQYHWHIGYAQYVKI